MTNCLPGLVLAALMLATPAAAEDLALLVDAAYPVTSPPVEGGAVILVRDGRILEVGPAAAVEVPDGFRRVERPGTWAFPGFVEIHSHAGGRDINDMVYPTNTDLQVLDNVVPFPENEALQDAVAGGVTTILFIPGSGTNISGFGVLLKTWAETVEEMVVRFPGCLKVAQAGNPERRSGDLGLSKMGMNWILRDLFRQGLAYHQAWEAWERGEAAEEPAYNARFHLLRGLYRREYPALVHTAWHVSTQATIRDFHDRFGIWAIPTHATFDGFKNAPLAAERGIHINVGPRQFLMDYDTAEMVGLAAEFWEGGVRNLSINTDAPVVPQEELSFQAAMAVRYGLPWEAAIRGITIVTAEAVGIEERVGSLEPGKDADVVLWRGDPLDPRSWVDLTLVEGRVAYDALRGERRF